MVVNCRYLYTVFEPIFAFRSKFIKYGEHLTGFGHEHFWTSGTDQGEEGHFFWMSTGRPLTFTNWNAGEPNNFRYENGEEEHCLELWNRDGKGLKWNDTPCSFETYFVCEVNWGGTRRTQKSAPQSQIRPTQRPNKVLGNFPYYESALPAQQINIILPWNHSKPQFYADTQLLF